MKRILQIGLLTVFMTLSLMAQPLVYRSGVLTFTCDRPDSNLLIDANEALRHLDLVYGSQTGLRVQDSIRVDFFYQRQLAGDALPDAPTWSGGLAKSGRRIYIYSPDRTDWYTTLKHELSHTILRQNNIRVPVWFDEGLAQTFADQWTWDHFNTLGAAVISDQVIPLSDIDMLFSFPRPKAQLAYAQSMHAFRFMMDYYGEGVVPALVTMPDSLGFRAHFEAITAETLADFEIAWRDHLKKEFWFYRFSRLPTWLWVLMPLIVILAFIQSFRKRRKKLKEWEAEEAAEDAAQGNA